MRLHAITPSLVGAESDHTSLSRVESSFDCDPVEFASVHITSLPMCEVGKSDHPLIHVLPLDLSVVFIVDDGELRDSK